MIISEVKGVLSYGLQTEEEKWQKIIGKLFSHEKIFLVQHELHENKDTV